MGTLVRMLAVACAVAAAAALASSIRADEAADGAAPNLTLRLEAKATYLFRLTETSRLRVAGDELRLEHRALANGNGDRAEIGRIATWDVGITPIETRPDGSVVAWLLPDRVRGQDTTGRSAPPTDAVPGMPRMTFDSDDALRAPPSPFVGRALKLHLSPSAHVVDATPSPLPPPADGSPPVADTITPEAAREFAQRFFQELPAEPPRAKVTWETSRALAPEFGAGVRDVQDLGRVVEIATISKCGASELEIRLKSKSGDAAAPAPPTPRAPAEADPRLKWRPVVTERQLVGFVTVSRATGLAKSRETTVYVEARRAELTLPGGTVDVKDPNTGATRRVQLPTAVPAQEETYEIETKLEAIESR